MSDTATVAVEVTDNRYLTLVHQPDGIGFSADGTAVWPADQFTFKRILDGSIRLSGGGTPLPPPTPVLAGDVISMRRSGLQSTFSVADLLAFFSVFVTLPRNPLPADIPAGTARIVKNTTTGRLSLWANDGGAMVDLLTLATS